MLVTSIVPGFFSGYLTSFQKKSPLKKKSQKNSGELNIKFQMISTVLKKGNVSDERWLQ
jgi:hypothetical protein